MITSLDHIQLAMPEGEEDRAIHFYTNIIGLCKINKPAALQSRGGVWFQIENDRQLHLGVEKPFVPAKKAHPCFVCNTLDDLADVLKIKNFPVIWDD